MYEKVITGYPYVFENPIAGKTGTTQNQSDGWFMGMVPNLATGVWVGGEDRAIHFKDIATLDFMQRTKFNYFWHQNDDYTLTSHGHIWSYPGKTYTPSTIVVMPEETNINFDLLMSTNCYGICSDHIGKFK